MSSNGQPTKTINLTYAMTNGRRVTAPLEAWVAALLASLDGKALETVLGKVEGMIAQRAVQQQKIITSLVLPKTQ